MPSSPKSPRKPASPKKGLHKNRFNEQIPPEKKAADREALRALRAHRKGKDYNPATQEAKAAAKAAAYEEKIITEVNEWMEDPEHDATMGSIFTGQTAAYKNRHEIWAVEYSDQITEAEVYVMSGYSSAQAFCVLLESLRQAGGFAVVDDLLDKAGIPYRLASSLCKEAGFSDLTPEQVMRIGQVLRTPERLIPEEDVELDAGIAAPTA